MRRVFQSYANLQFLIQDVQIGRDCESNLLPNLSDKHTYLQKAILVTCQTLGVCRMGHSVKASLWCVTLGKSTLDFAFFKGLELSKLLPTVHSVLLH